MPFLWSINLHNSRSSSCRSTPSLESCSTPMNIIQPCILWRIEWSSGLDINEFDYFGVSTSLEVIDHSTLFLSLAYCGTHNDPHLRLNLAIFMINEAHSSSESLSLKVTCSSDSNHSNRTPFIGSNDSWIWINNGLDHIRVFTYTMVKNFKASYTGQNMHLLMTRINYFPLVDLRSIYPLKASLIRVPYQPRILSSW